MIEMENGDIDMMSFVSGSRDIARLTENPEINVTDEGCGRWRDKLVGVQHPASNLGDVRVRQAIAYATDREFITEALHGGFSSTACCPIHGDSPFVPPDVEHYDLINKANALLDEAGFRLTAWQPLLNHRLHSRPAEQQQNR